METGIFAPGNDLRNCFTIEWHALGYPICGALKAEFVGFLELLDMLTDKSQVHGATPTTDMSWQWHCLQIWDSSRITAASCTSVFVLFLYKDLSKGKTSLGEKKKVAPASCFCLWVTVSSIYSAFMYWKYVTIAYQLQEIRPLTRQSTFLPVTPLVEINPLKQHLMAAIKHSSVSYVICIIW